MPDRLRRLDVAGLRAESFRSTTGLLDDGRRPGDERWTANPLELFENLKTRHTRHLQIEQHQIRVLVVGPERMADLAQGKQSLASIGGGPDLEARPEIPQDHAQKAHIGRAIVGNQDAHERFL